MVSFSIPNASALIQSGFFNVLIITRESNQANGDYLQGVDADLPVGVEYQVGAAR